MNPNQVAQSNNNNNNTFQSTTTSGTNTTNYAQNHDRNSNNGDELNPLTKRQLSGAAVAGGIAGLVVGGPILGVLAAGGAALAVTSKGNPGEVARECGDVVANAGDRLKRIDQEHHVVDKASKKVVKGCKWVSKRLKPKKSDDHTSSPASE